MVYILTNGKELTGFELILSNIPGSLGKVSSLIAEHDLNIEYIETCTIRESEYILFLVVNFTDSKIKPEELLEKLNKLGGYVIKASITPMIKDIIYPSRYCTKDLGGIRAILLSIANMKGLIEGLREKLGDDATNMLLYQIGYSVGKRVYDQYAKPRRIKAIDKAIQLLTGLGRGAGWGEVIEYKKQKNKITINVEDLWECETQKGKTDKPASNYVRGIITGFIHKTTGRPLEIRETKCIAKGDPYCQFQIKLKKKPSKRKKTKRRK